MNRQVFISEYNLKVPGFESKDDFIEHVLNKKTIDGFQEIIIDNEIKLLLAEPILNTNEEFYPKKSDIKAMRKDVVVGTFCLNELIGKSHLAYNRENIPLYVATGLSVDDFSNEFSVINNFIEDIICEDDTRKHHYKKFYPLVPPLIALRTLTNAIGSFGAQYTGLAGDNTTFGNTSASGFYALNEAYKKVKNGESDLAVVGGTNGASLFSFNTFRYFTEDISIWKESLCSVCLVLESAASLKKRNAKGVLEILSLSSCGKPPELSENTHGKELFSLLLKDLENDIFCIFSGGLTDREYLVQKNALEKKFANIFSLFPLLGNTGTPALLLSMILAIPLSRQGQFDSFYCFESDPYGREFRVHLKRCKE